MRSGQITVIEPENLMEMFATDLERLAFLLEADAAFAIDPDQLGADAAKQEAPSDSNQCKTRFFQSEQ